MGCGGGQNVLVCECGDELGGGWAEAVDAGGEPGLRGDRDLGAADAGGVEDAVGCVLRGGGDDGSFSSGVEPAELLFGLAGELGLDGGAGAHQARADGGDADAFETELGVEAFGEAGESEFAGDVGEQMWDGDLASDGGDVDDRSASALALRLREEAGEAGLDGVERGVEVGVHGAMKGFERLVLEGADLDDAGVVDEDVEATEAGVGLVDEVLDLGEIGEVCRDEEDLVGGRDTAFLEESLLGVIELDGIAGGEHEAGSGPAEAAGEREAEAAGAAGDEDDVSGGVDVPGASAARARDQETGGASESGEAGKDRGGGHGAERFFHDGY